MKISQVQKELVIDVSLKSELLDNRVSRAAMHGWNNSDDRG